MKDTHVTRYIGVGITMVCAAMLMTELIFTRIFSVIIGFHFAFFAISVALFGIGAASLFLHLRQHRFPEERTQELLSLGSVAFAIMILISDFVLVRVVPVWGLETMQHTQTGLAYFRLFVTYCFSAAPFFLGGFVLSLAVTRYASRIHSLYFFDLAGAALGCLLIIPGLSFLGAPVALVVVAALAALAGLPFSLDSKRKTSRALRLIPIIAAVVCIGLAALNPLIGLFKVRQAKNYHLASLPVEFNQWNSFSMVTVLGENNDPSKYFPGWGMSPKYKGEIPEQKTLLIDVGAMTVLTRFDGQLDSVQHLLHDLSSFAYNVRGKNNIGEVCVIGAGGGRDVLSALTAGAKHVRAVEINPLIVDGVVRGSHKEFTGGLYHRPDVTAVVEDGRAFIRSTTEKFDMIQISMVDTSAATAAGAFALTEASLYTVEAFDDYLAHLKPGGMITVSAVTTYFGDSGGRLSSLIWKALRNIGEDPKKNVVMLSTPWIRRNTHVMSNLIIKKEPFTKTELDHISFLANELGFHKTFIPGIPNQPKSIMRGIIESRDEAELAHRIKPWPLNVSPVSDDHPFFFYQNKLRDLWYITGIAKLIRPNLPKRKMMCTGLPIALSVATITTVLVILFFIIPFIFSKKEIYKGKGRPLFDLVYVACLGFGFMFIEVGLIQKFTIYLGFPTSTLAVVLFVLLGAGALGSRIFGLIPHDKRRFGLALAIGGLVLFMIGFWQSGLANYLLTITCGWPISGRILIAALLLAPAGLLLGIPLPSGIFAVSQRAGTRIPWLWAMNSATSVFGSVWAAFVSIQSGISYTIWVGIVLYAIALPISTKVTAKMKS